MWALNKPEAGYLVLGGVGALVSFCVCVFDVKNSVSSFGFGFLFWGVRAGFGFWGIVFGVVLF